jgi:hypothetical protein
MARLAIAVISVVNSSSALAAPKAPVQPCAADAVSIEETLRGAPARVHRPPRVPRREAYLHGEWRVGEW